MEQVRRAAGGRCCRGETPSTRVRCAHRDRRGGAMNSTDLEPHPLAGRIPEMLSDEYVDLVKDIQKHGLREPLVLFEGKILDGRHRYRACAELGIEPKIVEFAGTKAEAEACV